MLNGFRVYKKSLDYLFYLTLGTVADVDEGLGTNCVIFLICSKLREIRDKPRLWQKTGPIFAQLGFQIWGRTEGKKKEKKKGVS